MYLNFYKLKELPFRLAPEPRFLHWTVGHSAALGCLRFASVRPNGCAALIAHQGAGKTILLEWLAQNESPGDLVRIHFPPRSEAELNEILSGPEAGPAQRGPTLVICDNAHLLSEAMLATLLLKTLLPPAHARLTRIVLAGEPALAHALESPMLDGFGESWGERFHLPPLTASEVTAYIAHRLRMAGAQGAPLFRPEICAEVHRETQGNPRLVNALCDAALVLACERELKEVGSAEIRRGLEEVGRLAAARLDVQPAAAVAPPIEPPVELHASAFARVKLVRAGAQILERVLPRGRLSVGRDADNDLCINGKFVSRHHCQIVTTEQMCIIEEVRSTNGLFVNQRRVRHHRLQDGDVVQIGDHHLHYASLRDARGDAEPATG